VWLRFQAPFDGDGLIRFLVARAVPGVEEAIPGGYRRSLALPRGAGVVDLVPRVDHVDARFLLDDPRDLDHAVSRCRALLDLNCDPIQIAEHLGEDPVIGGLVRTDPGRRVPGHPDGAELAIRAVLGQQVSVVAATKLASRLVDRLGTSLARPLGAVTRLFPTPASLAALDPGTMGMPRARARAVIALATALDRGELRLDEDVDRDASAAALLALPGIGPWTVGYIAMRALRDPDAFTPGDAGLRHGLRLLGRDTEPHAVAAMSERWRPYRAYAIQHLWALAAAGAR
jgi:AraC family transcriptional regulator of adaptative response / DNA-3-methyladenine glycosylase II